MRYGQATDRQRDMRDIVPKAWPNGRPTIVVDSIWDKPVDTFLLSHGFDEARSAVGLSLLGVRWLGTHYRTISVIHRSTAVASGAAEKLY